MSTRAYRRALAEKQGDGPSDVSKSDNQDADADSSGGENCDLIAKPISKFSVDILDDYFGGEDSEQEEQHEPKEIEKVCESKNR